MNAKLRKAYLALRTQHPTAGARTLLTWARTPKVKPLDWQDGRDGLPRATWTVDGFEVVARVGYDEGGTIDFLGSFHERHIAGAVRVRAPAGYRCDSHGCVWYLPENSYADHYKGLLKLKFGRAEADRLARSYVNADLDRLRRYADGDLSLLCVGVTASRAGVKLGTSGLHGIDVDSPRDPYIDEVARDIAGEAIFEAKEKLAKLCASA
jgi:hypothetical protein